MNMASVLISIILVLCCNVATAMNEVQCYECSSPDCKTGSCTGSACQKFESSTDGKFKITKKLCVPSISNVPLPQLGCTATQLNNMQGTMCTCNGNWCNSGQRLTAPKILGFFTIISICVFKILY